MPNWCVSEWTVRGNKAAVREFVDKFKAAFASGHGFADRGLTQSSAMTAVLTSPCGVPNPEEPRNPFACAPSHNQQGLRYVFWPEYTDKVASTTCVVCGKPGSEENPVKRCSLCRTPYW